MFCLFVVCCLVCSFLFWLLKYFVVVYVVLACNHWLLHCMLFFVWGANDAVGIIAQTTYSMIGWIIRLLWIWGRSADGVYGLEEFELRQASCIWDPGAWFVHPPTWSSSMMSQQTAPDPLTSPSWHPTRRIGERLSMALEASGGTNGPEPHGAFVGAGDQNGTVNLEAGHWSFVS